ncbi:hypothetical protein HU200_055483 [Digitaria exilis]|uniref:Uncharacterized protein n=1 Tax=Digitaria exilis TaxID=1010633 RepID=A0A835ASF5_9POAL|nr:hypothetical protein HU200_055483 [Digitaria exilis]
MLDSSAIKRTSYNIYSGTSSLRRTSGSKRGLGT